MEFKEVSEMMRVGGFYPLPIEDYKARCKEHGSFKSMIEVMGPGIVFPVVCEDGRCVEPFKIHDAPPVSKVVKSVEDLLELYRDFNVYMSGRVSSELGRVKINYLRQREALEVFKRGEGLTNVFDPVKKLVRELKWGRWTVEGFEDRMYRDEYMMKVYIYMLEVSEYITTAISKREEHA
jgi:hypothetical protein